MVLENQNLVTRPPVVVILGHVDHGKTTLLNTIRQIEFSGEKPGGVITQHIGAFEIEVAETSPGSVKEGRKITFIDTPGHEAFSAMRSRGAKVADIAILVVDASQSVQAQTKEAISHIKKAGIPLIVAINKIDLPQANPEKVKRDLAKEDILVEELGGKIPSVEVSAKTGQGIPELLELILLVAEMEGLKADLQKPAQGVVIESYLDSQRGPTATLILNQGKLIPGQIIATPSTFGKIKSIEDFQGNSISQALPSQPVIILGFGDVPRVGEEFKVFSDLAEVQNYIRSPEKKVPEVLEVSTEQKVLNLILKTDVLGSAEAIEEVLKKLPQEEVILRILKAEVGEITESDIKLAIQAKAKILGFRVKINPVARALSEREKVKIMQFDVIYDLVEGVRKYMEKMLEPEKARIDLGKVKVLVDFWSEKNRQIVGGRVIEGEVKKGTLIEILREEAIVGRGRMINLQKNKKDIEKASQGEEIGILYEGEKKIEKGDILVIYQEEKRKAEL
jgi:translation initiation factor IF-2